MQRKHPSQPLPATLKRELIVQCWENLARPPVDATLLEEIERELAERFGNDPTSPASIARLLADEGAELRHPEVIEFDAKWREEQFKKQAGGFSELDQLLSARQLNLEQAAELIRRVETLRQRFENENDASGLSELRRLVIEMRQRIQVMTKRSSPEAAAQAEIAEWLKVWLQTPLLFFDWLELRRRSNEFRERFSV